MVTMNSRYTGNSINDVSQMTQQEYDDYVALKQADWKAVQNKLKKMHKLERRIGRGSAIIAIILSLLSAILAALLVLNHYRIMLFHTDFMLLTLWAAPLIIIVFTILFFIFKRKACVIRRSYMVIFTILSLLSLLALILSRYLS